MRRADVSGMTIDLTDGSTTSASCCDACASDEPLFRLIGTDGALCADCFGVVYA